MNYGFMGDHQTPPWASVTLTTHLLYTFSNLVIRTVQIGCFHLRC